MSRSKRHGKKGARVYDFDTDSWKEEKKGTVVEVTPQYGGAGGGTGMGGGKTYMGTPYVKCHHNACDVLYTQRESGVSLFGGARFDLDPAGLDLVVDCSGLGTEFLKPALKVIPKEFEALREFATMPLLLTIDWPDRSTPLLSGGFWGKLWELLQPQWQVAFCCVGGHGRTGTALACMMVADGWPAREAIRHVREWHCSKAIETRSQEVYIEAVQRELWGKDEKTCPLHGEDSVEWVVGKQVVEGTVVEG